MRPAIAQFGFALGRAVLSFAYWVLVLTCLYGAVAGDRRADAPPQTNSAPIAIVVLAILIYAMLTTVWASRRR